MTCLLSRLLEKVICEDWVVESDIWLVGAVVECVSLYNWKLVSNDTIVLLLEVSSTGEDDSLPNSELARLFVGSNFVGCMVTED